mgnify:CR=1 FL=1
MKKFSLFMVSLALIGLSLGFFSHPIVKQSQEHQELTNAAGQVPQMEPQPVAQVADIQFHAGLGYQQAEPAAVQETQSPRPIQVARAQIFGGGGLGGLMALLAEYWQKISAVILAAATFIEVIVRITPTEKDNAWFSWLKSILDKIIPNNKVGGGTHS